MRAAVLWIDHPWLEDKGHPDVGIRWIGQRRWRHSYNSVVFTVDGNWTANNVRVGGKLAVPQPAGDDDDMCRAFGVFAGDQPAAKKHRAAKHVEESGAHTGRIEASRLGTGDTEVGARALLERRDRNEAARLLAVVDEVGSGEKRELSILYGGADQHKLSGLR